MELKIHFFLLKIGEVGIEGFNVLVKFFGRSL